MSFPDPEELVPDIGSRSVSAGVQCRLDVAELLSTSELATQIGVTTQALANNEAFFVDRVKTPREGIREGLANNEAFFADLEAASLLEREDPLRDTSM